MVSAYYYRKEVFSLMTVQLANWLKRAVVTGLLSQIGWALNNPKQVLLGGPPIWPFILMLSQ